jgi:hypothetical protein
MTTEMSKELLYTPKSNAKFRINTYENRFTNEQFFRVEYKERFFWHSLDQILGGYWVTALHFNSEKDAQNLIDSIRLKTNLQ